MAEPWSGRRRFLTGLGSLAVGAVALGISPSWPAASPAKGDAPDGTGKPVRAVGAGQGPNFVVVIADDVGIGELGCYGQKKIHTPNLDRLAAQGLRFTDAYAAAPVCAPARASLFTGLHTGHSPVRRNPPKTGDLPLGPLPTFASVLQSHGYRTGLFGKWGFSHDQPGPDSPDRHGFEEFFGYLTHHAAHSYYPERLWHNEQPTPLPGNTGETGAIFGPDLIMQRALEWIGGRNDDPFLMVLTPNLPHAPSVIPDLGEYAGKDWTEPNKIHAAQVSRLDSYIGQLIDQLQAKGLADNTIVIFSSDNGPHEEGGVNPDFFDGNGRFRGYKRNLYEGGIRVPFIVWSPKLLARTAGKTTSHTAIHYDLFPTLADFAAAPAPAGVDGLSLRKVFTGTRGAPEHEFLYWVRTYYGKTPRQVREDHGRGKKVAAAVRFGHWKVVGFGPGQNYSPPGPKWQFELYDLRKDPGERHNLAKKHPVLLRRGVRYIRTSWRTPAAA